MFAYVALCICVYMCMGTCVCVCVRNNIHNVIFDSMGTILGVHDGMRRERDFLGDAAMTFRSLRHWES